MLTASVTLVDQVCGVFYFFLSQKWLTLKYSYRIVKGSSINYVTPKGGVRLRAVTMERCFNCLSVTLVDQVCAVFYFFTDKTKGTFWGATRAIWTFKTFSDQLDPIWLSRENHFGVLIEPERLYLLVYMSICIKWYLWEPLWLLLGSILFDCK